MHTEEKLKSGLQNSNIKNRLPRIKFLRDNHLILNKYQQEAKAIGKIQDIGKIQVCISKLLFKHLFFRVLLYLPTT